ncbi:hypothetical protein I6A60_05990 [Frankia sp. AgB1.9]|uniref:hypothetical protein n=1 Tax=unclassified Frankia TaxID=2632575 RepID=UPI001933A2E9|nr:MULTISPECIES: hypothetical protein [unclassified Frankia]MBL7487469.1 hypothetical protein [Frankia sp. AgW1.1]MBL7547431.1 hypothetical protein [Frankia sp. AgB1.9]MBL7618794.1 hypothetical protein [Frankia sp. AgB1.8]
MSVVGLGGARWGMSFGSVGRGVAVSYGYARGHVLSGESDVRVLGGRHVRWFHGETSGQCAGARPRRGVVGLLVCLVVLLGVVLAGCGRPPKDVTAVVALTATSAEPAPALSDALAATMRAEAGRS